MPVKLLYAFIQRGGESEGRRRRRRRRAREKVEKKGKRI